MKSPQDVADEFHHDIIQKSKAQEIFEENLDLEITSVEIIPALKSEPTLKMEDLEEEVIRVPVFPNDHMEKFIEKKGKERAEEKADRYNDGKVQWSLVDFPSIEPMVRVLEFGAKKYAPHNWKKGLGKEKILESMMRHMVALFNGEENDPESGLSHMGHIQCNAMFYNYENRNKTS